MYEGKLVLCGVGGSYAMGLATPSSDVDLFNVYVRPREHYLGVTGNFKPTIQGYMIVNGKHTDVTTIDYRSFVSGLCRSNPNYLRLLFLDEYKQLAPAGYTLVKLRTFFLTKQVHVTFGGYAASCLKDYRKGGEGKDLANGILLLWQAAHILRYQNLKLQPHAALLDKLVALKANQMGATEALELYERSDAAMKRNLDKSTLRDAPDQEWASKLCVDAILDTWKEESAQDD